MDFNVFAFIGIVVGLFLAVGIGMITFWITTSVLQEQDE